jgi:phytoene dehydrogenase-like protein
LSALPPEADAVVIGAGHNGLVAANYLVDAGLSVAVLERRPGIGGMARSEYSIAQAPRHLVNHCAVDPVFWPSGPAARDLKPEEYGLRWVKVDPAFVYLHPSGESIAFWREPERTVQEIRRFSRADGDAYRELAQLWDAVCDVAMPMFASDPTRPSPRAVAAAVRGAVRHRRSLAEIGAFLTASGADQVAERFTHPVVASAVNVASACMYPSSFPSSTIQMLILAFVHRYDCLRPVGGTQAIPDALAARLTARGAVIATSAEVAAIEVQAGRATAVALADGRTVRARRAVIAAGDARRALVDLLPAAALPERLARRAAAIPSNALGWGQLKLDIACGGRLDLSRFERERGDDADLRAATQLIGTMEGIERGYRRAAAGLLPRPDEMGFYNTIPTGADPSQAPDGQDCLYLIAITSPAEPEGGWTPDVRDRAFTDASRRAADFYGGLEELELGRSQFTNTEMGEEVGATSQGHVDWHLNRMGPLRPAPGFGGFRTPVRGLYLAGAGCHPGPGVTGLPGHNGAHAVLADLRRRR